MLNLLSNAVKYNSEGGSVHLSGENIGDNKVRISVRDTGPGIDMGRVAELFEPYNRLSHDNGNEGVEGTGIGLGISRKLVEMMGGELGLDSVISEGSCFWVDLPVASNQAKYTGL